MVVVIVVVMTDLKEFCRGSSLSLSPPPPPPIYIYYRYINLSNVSLEVATYTPLDFLDPPLVVVVEVVY